MQSFEEDIDSSSILEKINIKEKLYDAARFDLSTFIDDSEVEIQGSFNYATSLYGEEIVSKFAKTYLLILEQFVEYKEKLNIIRVNEIDYLNSNEYNQIITLCLNPSLKWRFPSTASEETLEVTVVSYHC